MSRGSRRRSASTTRTDDATESSLRLTYAEKAKALLRESLIDAAEEALTRRSWTAIRMADIATAVGVSRQTVYNEFGSKDELGRALLLRESAQFLDEVEAALDDHPKDPVGGLTAAFEVFLRRTHEEPLLRAIIGGSDSEGSDLGPLLTGQGAAVLPFITDRLANRFTTEWPDVDRASVEAYADAVVRLAISHVAFPNAEPQEAATVVGRVFAPYLLQITAGKPKRR